MAPPTTPLSGQDVAKLPYDNQVVWLLAPHKGWGVNHQGLDLNQYLLVPLDANGQLIADASVVNGWANHPALEWNWYQHSIQLMPNGNLITLRQPHQPQFVYGRPRITAAP